MFLLLGLFVLGLYWVPLVFTSVLNIKFSTIRFGIVKIELDLQLLITRFPCLDLGAWIIGGFMGFFYLCFSFVPM